MRRISERQQPQSRRSKKQKQENGNPKRFKLRTIDDVNELNEWLVNRVISGQIDPKNADIINTIVKNTGYFNGRLKMDYGKLLVMAQIKKIQLPPNLLPILS